MGRITTERTEKCGGGKYKNAAISLSRESLNYAIPPLQARNSG
jgi:hypothetical protein